MCIPGVLLTIPMLSKTYDNLKQRPNTDTPLPTKRKFIIISIIQSAVLVVIAADVGVYLSSKTHLGAPFLSQLANFQFNAQALLSQLIAGLIVSALGSVLFLVSYYYFFTPMLDEKTVNNMLRLRSSIGFWGRVLYGGIVEEVICRFGLMSVFVWLGVLVTGTPDVYIMWMAILLSGLLFALGHIPAYISFGCESSQTFMLTVICMNLLASIIFGWLFWYHGLTAAMIGHAFLHIIWYRIDLNSNFLR